MGHHQDLSLLDGGVLSEGLGGPGPVSFQLSLLFRCLEGNSIVSAGKLPCGYCCLSTCCCVDFPHDLFVSAAFSSCGLNRYLLFVSRRQSLGYLGGPRRWGCGKGSGGCSVCLRSFNFLVDSLERVLDIIDTSFDTGLAIWFLGCRL